MKIKRYRIEPDYCDGQFRVIDILKDEPVCVPLTYHTADGLADIMGEDMDIECNTEDIHPDYLEET